MGNNTKKIFKLGQVFSLVLLITGLVLLPYMILVEGELGALPLFLVLAGSILFGANVIFKKIYSKISSYSRLFLLVQYILWFAYMKILKPKVVILKSICLNYISPLPRYLGIKGKRELKGIKNQIVISYNYPSA